MAAAALESNAPRSVSLSHAELTLVKSSSTCGGSSLLKRGVPQSLSASMVWRTAQLARIAEAGRGFVLGEGAEAKAVTDALGAALCTLEHSIEEEVCAWDDREWNYVAAMAALEASVVWARTEDQRRTREQLEPLQVRSPLISHDLP